MIKNRINELNKYQKASIYADYKENKFLITDGTIILFDEYMGYINWKNHK